MHFPRRNGTEEPNSPAELLLTMPNNNFIIIPGYFAATVFFDTIQKNFYRYCRNDVVNSKSNFKCADFMFLLFVNRSKEVRKCPTKPGEPHNHEVVSQEMLELAAVFWECLLRIFSHHPKETNLQSIESVVSSWPHQLSFPLSAIQSKLSPSLNCYRKKATNNEFVQQFLTQHGKDKVARFRQVISQFQTNPANLGQFK